MCAYSKGRSLKPSRFPPVFGQSHARTGVSTTGLIACRPRQSGIPTNYHNNFIVAGRCGCSSRPWLELSVAQRCTASSSCHFDFLVRAVSTLLVLPPFSTVLWLSCRFFSDFLLYCVFFCRPTSFNADRGENWAAESNAEVFLPLTCFSCSGYKYIGDHKTNNEAEYEGMILGLLAAVRLGTKRLIVKGDSMLVIQQVRETRGKLLYVRISRG